MTGKEVKVGVKHGGGPKPHYEWNVLILNRSFVEACDFLDDAQYRHMALQVKELAMQRDPTHSQTVSVEKIEDFYEIRDKGGPLGNLNVRVFFGVEDNGRNIVVLGTIVKKNDGQTRKGDKVRMRRRWRKYRHGDYGKPQL